MSECPSFPRLNNSTFAHTTFACPSSIAGHLGCCHLLATANTAAMNKVCKPLWGPAFITVGYMPRSGIAGSHGHSIFCLLRTCYVTIIFSCLGCVSLWCRPAPVSALTVKTAVGITVQTPVLLPLMAGASLSTETRQGRVLRAVTDCVREPPWGWEQACLTLNWAHGSLNEQTLQWAGIQHPIILI